MRGLVIKDILNLRQQAKIYVGIMVLFFVVGILNEDASYFGSFSSVFIMLIPMTSIAYDERAKWDRYALTMPVSRADIANSKYAMSILVLIVVTLLIAIGNFIIIKDLGESLLLTLTIAPLGLIVSDIFIPTLYRFGTEKSRALFLGLFVLIMIIGFLGNKFDIHFSLGTGMFESRGLMVALVWAVAAVATVVSMAISRRIYEIKDF
ncbi:MAG: ABC-2 transporter permease [Clostridiales bacterium]|nr:ABC-2 transporter permease [Clostridiales bacterium]